VGGYGLRTIEGGLWPPSGVLEVLDGDLFALDLGVLDLVSRFLDGPGLDDLNPVSQLADGDRGLTMELVQPHASEFQVLGGERRQLVVDGGGAGVDAGALVGVEPDGEATLVRAVGHPPVRPGTDGLHVLGTGFQDLVDGGAEARHSISHPLGQLGVALAFGVVLVRQGETGSAVADAEYHGHGGSEVGHQFSHTGSVTQDYVVVCDTHFASLSLRFMRARLS